MPVDFLSVIRAGQSLVPDIRAQMLQDDERRARTEQRNLQAQQLQQKQQRQTEFQQAAAAALGSGNPREIANLMVAYPEFADSIKPGWEAMRDDDRRATLTQVGSVYARANAGDPKGAAKILRQRYEADVQAGAADPEDLELIEALESDNPQLHKQATATIGARLAAYDPSKFAETYKAINPTDKTSPAIREYNDRVAQFGKEAADEWLAVQDTKLIAVNEGGQVWDAADIVAGRSGSPASTTPAQRGGDQSTGVRAGISPQGSAIEQAALAAVPGLTVTSRQRSPSRNASVGGVRNSYHLTDQARDFVPPKGMSFGMLSKRLRDALPGFDVINEGDHVHVEPGSGSARSSASPTPKRVRSIQEARALPSGTLFITPDGRTMRKP